MFNINDSVKFKDNDERIFKIYSIYNKKYVSLGLYEYPEIEQDYLINVKNLKLIS